ncbi:MAG: FAD-dependent oxidoreductase, partial [Micromonosporaceae bacterium]
VYELLRAAIDVLPEVAEYELTETGAGLRPGTPDNAPLLGPTDDARMVAATGHYRNGILLTPVTVDLVTEYLDSGVVPEQMKPFDPRRFAGPPATPGQTGSEEEAR